MALEAFGRRFCKLTHSENGKVINRRIHTMVVQAADGRVHHITGDKLPELISLNTGKLYSGAHVAEVLLNPKSADAVTLMPGHRRWPDSRDALHLLIGMFFMLVFIALAELTAQSLVG